VRLPMSGRVQTTDGYAAKLVPIARSKRLQKAWACCAGLSVKGSWPGPEPSPNRRHPRVAKEKDADHHSAAELLGDWRAAERDTAAAKSAASVAALALRAASAAGEAALEAEAAVKAALDAAERAQIAADRAKHAATQAAEAAHLLATSAESDQARANHAVVEAESAETDARDRFHEAEGRGFPKVTT